MAGLINRFHRHSAREGCIADQSDDVVILTFAIARDRHPQRSGEGSRSMAGAERVVFRFVAPQKAADAAVLFYGRKLFAAPRQNLMRVGLMADVPNQTVARRIKGV